MPAATTVITRTITRITVTPAAEKRGGDPTGTPRRQNRRARKRIGWCCGSPTKSKRAMKTSLSVGPDLRAGRAADVTSGGPPGGRALLRSRAIIAIMAVLLHASSPAAELRVVGSDLLGLEFSKAFYEF